MIKFTVPATGKVMLKVFNTVGQEVATLVNEVKEADSYEVNFNAANLPSGIYMYKLTAGKYSFAKKMIIMK